MSYWDTSCLVKLYAAEADSAQFRMHAAALIVRPTTGDFARLELLTTLRRKEAEGLLHEGQAERLLTAFDEHVIQGVIRLRALDDMMRAEFARVVEHCFSQTPPIFVRTLDALHLAAGRLAGETEFVATDKRLREAAALFGFTLFPPP